MISLDDIRAKITEFSKNVLLYALPFVLISGFSGCTRPNQEELSSSSCSSEEDQENQKENSIIISDFKLEFDDKIYRRKLNFKVQTTDSDRVYGRIIANGDLKDYFYIDLESSENGMYEGTYPKKYLSSSVLDSSLFPYTIEIQVSTETGLEEPSVYSTTLTMPFPIFGKKAQNEVSKLEKILENFISEKKQEDVYNAMYYTPLGIKKIKVSLFELQSAKEFMVKSDNSDGSGMLLYSYLEHALNKDATMVEYSVKEYQTPVGESLTLGEYLKYILGIKYKKIWYDPDKASTEVIAPRPKEIFKNSRSKDESLLYPMYEAKMFMVDEDNYVGAVDRYYRGILPTTSKEPIYTLKYFLNHNNLFGFNEETGDILTLMVNAKNFFNNTEASIMIFSSLYFTGPVPGSDFYRQVDAVIIENNWDRPIYRLSEIPDEYKSLVQDALEEAIETIDSSINY